MKTKEFIDLGKKVKACEEIVIYIDDSEKYCDIDNEIHDVGVLIKLADGVNLTRQQILDLLIATGRIDENKQANYNRKLIEELKKEVVRLQLKVNHLERKNEKLLEVTKLMGKNREFCSKNLKGDEIMKQHLIGESNALITMGFLLTDESYLDEMLAIYKRNQQK